MARLTEVPEPAMDAARGETPPRPVASRRMPLMKPSRTLQPAFDLGGSQTCCRPRLLLAIAPRRPLTASNRAPARPLLLLSVSCAPEDTDPTQGTSDTAVVHSSRQPPVRGMSPSPERRSRRLLTTDGLPSTTKRQHPRSGTPSGYEVAEQLAALAGLWRPVAPNGGGRPSQQAAAPLVGECGSLSARVGCSFRGWRQLAVFFQK
jgi:hypothetical protein